VLVSAPGTPDQVTVNSAGLVVATAGLATMVPFRPPAVSLTVETGRARTAGAKRRSTSTAQKAMALHCPHAAERQTKDAGKASAKLACAPVNEAGGLVGPRPVSNQKQAQREVETAVIGVPFQWHAELGSNVHPGRSNTLGGARRE